MRMHVIVGYNHLSVLMDGKCTEATGFPLPDSLYMLSVSGLKVCTTCPTTERPVRTLKSDREPGRTVDSLTVNSENDDLRLWW